MATEKLQAKLVINSMDNFTIEFEDWGHGVFGNQMVKISGADIDAVEGILEMIERFNQVEDHTCRQEFIEYLYEEVDYINSHQLNLDFITKWLNNHWLRNI